VDMRKLETSRVERLQAEYQERIEEIKGILHAMGVASGFARKWSGFSPQSRMLETAAAI